jgi:hypothetical protein
MLKKRKSPLTDLFPEREGIRIKMITNKTEINNAKILKNKHHENQRQNSPGRTV